MAVEFKIKKHNGLPILTVKGRLINVDSEKFQKKLEGFCKKKYPRTIIDISEVTFIDSFGLGTLVQHHSQMQKAGCMLIIVNTNNNPNLYVHRLFDMTGLKRVFNITNSYEGIA